MFVEEWLSTVKHKANIYEIFVNPTSKELMSLPEDEVRWAVDFEKGKVYVFSVNLLHGVALDEVGGKISGAYNLTDRYSAENFCFGIGEVKEGKIVPDSRSLYDLLSQNDKFDKVKKFFKRDEK